MQSASQSSDAPRVVHGMPGSVSAMAGSWTPGAQEWSKDLVWQRRDITMSTVKVKLRGGKPCRCCCWKSEQLQRCPFPSLCAYPSLWLPFLSPSPLKHWLWWTALGVGLQLSLCSWRSCCAHLCAPLRGHQWHCCWLQSSTGTPAAESCPASAVLFLGWAALPASSHANSPAATEAKMH